MTSSRFVIPALLILSVLHVGQAVRCFECMEEKGGDGICRGQNGDRHAATECAHSCIKHTLAPFSFEGVESGELIARICSDPSYCQIGTALMEEKIGLKTISCTSCRTDYCNSASTTIPSFALVAVLLVKYYIL